MTNEPTTNKLVPVAHNHCKQSISYHLFTNMVIFKRTWIRRDEHSPTLVFPACFHRMTNLDFPTDFPSSCTIKNDAAYRCIQGRCTIWHFPVRTCVYQITLVLWSRMTRKRWPTFSSGITNTHTRRIPHSHVCKSCTAGPKNRYDVQLALRLRWGLQSCGAINQSYEHHLNSAMSESYYTLVHTTCSS